MKNLRLFVIAVVFLCVFSVSAENAVFSNRLSSVPVLSYEKLYSGDDEYECLGAGLEISYDRLIDKANILSVSAAARVYEFDGLHSFIDLRGTVAGKFQILPFSAKSPVRLYAVLGGGAGYSMRDDSDNSLTYHLAAGVQLNIKHKESRDLFFKVTSGLTMRDGEMTTDASLAFGFSFGFGSDTAAPKEKKEKSVQVAEVRVPEIPQTSQEPAPAAEPETPVETVHVHNVVSGYSILEPTETRNGYRFYICSECGLICEILDPVK